VLLIFKFIRCIACIHKISFPVGIGWIFHSEKLSGKDIRKYNKISVHHTSLLNQNWFSFLSGFAILVNFAEIL